MISFKINIVIYNAKDYRKPGAVRNYLRNFLAKSKGIKAHAGSVNRLQIYCEREEGNLLMAESKSNNLLEVEPNGTIHLLKGENGTEEDNNLLKSTARGYWIMLTNMLLVWLNKRASF